MSAKVAETETDQLNLEQLRQRLADAEQALEAIRAGEVDALIVRGLGGHQVFHLQDPNILYRVFFDEMADGAVTLATDGTILYCNHGLTGLLRLPFERLAGVRWESFVAATDRARLGELFGQAAKGVVHAEFTMTAGDGTPVPVRLAASSFHSGDLPITCLVVTDLSERKRHEAELQKVEWLLSEEREALTSQAVAQPYGDLVQLNTARLLVDTVGAPTLGEIARHYVDLLDSSAAIYETNGDYALGIFSSGWCRFMDQASRRLAGTDDNAAALRSGKWLCHESCWDCSRQSIESGAPVDVECKGGIRLYAVPVRAGGKIVGSINLGYGDPPRDPVKLQELAGQYGVTVEALQEHAQQYDSRPAFLINVAKERLKHSAQLVGAIVEARQAQAEAEHLNRTLEGHVKARTAELEASKMELEAFAYSVSHDLRAPLRAIDGFSQILLKEYVANLPEQPRRYLQLVCDNTRQMGRLIDDILHLSRLGRQSLAFETVDPRPLIDQCLAELHGERHGRSVTVEIGALPPCWGDAGLLKQVWFNLLANAHKFTRKRAAARIEVGSTTRSRQECVPPHEPETVYFVKDNGVGFDMQYAGKLFSAFQRLHSMEEYEGTGIGLALVRRIVQRHGGNIWADAAVDRGATFYFTLAKGHARG